jgi:hypothetical protein
VDDHEQEAKSIRREHEKSQGEEGKEAIPRFPPEAQEEKSGYSEAHPDHAKQELAHPPTPLAILPSTFIGAVAPQRNPT